MVGSTSNPGRKGGGTSHYRIDNHPIHFLCRDIEAQLDERIEIEKMLKAIDEEEARVLRLYASGMAGQASEAADEPRIAGSTV